MLRRLIIFLMLMAVGTACSANGMWVKGNTHTHTTMSDGSKSPEYVVNWYKDHGYNFLAITDHHVFTDPKNLSYLETENFILLPGQEVTGRQFPSKRSMHMTALRINKAIPRDLEKNMAETIRAFLDRIEGNGGIAILNHPNYGYSLDYRDFEVDERIKLFELYCYGAGSHNEGNFFHPQVEQTWDTVLSHGLTMYGLATDDAHHFAPEPFGPERDNPGGAWVMVKVNELTPEEVYKNLLNGNFYSSTGPELSDYTYDGKSIHIAVKPEKDTTYRILFIGKYGQILRDINGTEATYVLTGSPREAYVRAKIISSNKFVVWTQPVRPRECSVN